MELCIAYKTVYLKWVKLPADIEDIAELFGVDLSETTDLEEELRFEDIETDLDFPRYCLQSFTLDELNDLAECEYHYHDEAVAISEAYGINDVEWTTCRNAILYEGVTNAEELGETLVDYDYLAPIPAHLQNYIDYEKVGESWEWEGTYTSVGFLMNL